MYYKQKKGERKKLKTVKVCKLTEEQRKGNKTNTFCATTTEETII